MLSIGGTRVGGEGVAGGGGEEGGDGGRGSPGMQKDYSAELCPWPRDTSE